MTAADSRTSLRERRRRIPAAQREAAALDMCRRVFKQDFFAEARTIAFYSAIDGEIDPRPLLEAALRRDRRCYLPITPDNGPLLFAPVSETTAMKHNRWGIPEPPAENLLPPARFDLVLVPLVGFDTACNRLGMGKGFYDRTFAFKRGDAGGRPYLAGLAYERQLVEAVSVAAHDVPLDAVVTERRIHRPFRH